MCDLCSAYHLAHYFGHERLGGIGSHLHFLVRHLNRRVLQSEVGYYGYAECAYATMMSHYDLRHGAHTHSVATHAVIHTIFGRSLECRSLYAHVHAMHHTDALLAGYVVSLVDERLIWSVIIIRSPILNSGFMPPDALLTKRVLMPSSYMTRMGKVTSFIE